MNRLTCDVHALPTLTCQCGFKIYRRSKSGTNRIDGGKEQRTKPDGGDRYAVKYQYIDHWPHLNTTDLH